MSQQIAVAAPTPESNQALPSIGAIIQGGYFAGQIMVDGVLHGLVMSGASGELSGRWNKATLDRVASAESFVDGAANTAAMAVAGSPLAKATLALDIAGFTDWYIPSRDELELLYRNFKPSTTGNWIGDGANEHSMPPGAAYTSTNPAQTTVATLIEGAADALVPAWYWSSTQYAANPSNAWGQYFDDGFQSYYHKSCAGRARAVRRFKI